MTANSLGFSSCSSNILCYWRPGSHRNEPRARLFHEAKSQLARKWRDSAKQNNGFRFVVRRCVSPYSFMFVLLFSILLFSTAVNAENALSVRRRVQSDELLFDRRQPPIPAQRFRTDHDRHLILRDDSLESQSPPSGHDSTTQQPQIPLPNPFDTNLGNNFTTGSCPTFFNHFLNNATFQSCIPFSLLLQTSNEFFSITRSPLRLATTLEATCNVNFHQCSSVMASLAQQIQLEEHCGSDLRMQNPMVQAAYHGFIAYRPLYQAGCLRDSSGDFCYSNAVKDISSWTSSYIYYLPLGVELPLSAQPACNTCLRDTMEIFATYAGDSNQPLSTDYAGAAQQVDESCGPQFAQASVVTTSAGASIRGNNLHLLALILGYIVLVL